MKIEAIDGSGTEHFFYTKNNNAYCPKGDHKVEIPLRKSSYLLAIDNGTNSLGLCISEISTQKIFFACNLMRTDGDTPYEFSKKMEIFLKHLIDTIDRIDYLKLEEPYNSRDPRFAHSYATLKANYDIIKKIALDKGMIFIPTLPTVWFSSFISKEEKDGRGNKTLIKHKVKSIYPMIKLKNQDVYDAIGLKESFFIEDIAENCFIRVSTSTLQKKRLNKPLKFDFFEINTEKEIILDSLFDLPKEDRNLIINGFSQFGYNSRFSLVENFTTALNYRPYSLLFSVINVDEKILPDLYLSKNKIKNVYKDKKLLLVGHTLEQSGEFII